VERTVGGVALEVVAEMLSRLVGPDQKLARLVALHNGYFLPRVCVAILTVSTAAVGALQGLAVRSQQVQRLVQKTVYDVVL
jgi:hypothetical protein